MSGCPKCRFRKRNTCAGVGISLSSSSALISQLYICYRYDCNGTQAQRWIIKRGSTKVQIAGTDFCLDAGTSQWFASEPFFAIM